MPLTRMDNEDPALIARILAAISAVAETGQFTLGEEVERFEEEFARYCQAGHAVGVSSGTDALVLALQALRIGAGDEVLVPTNSFIATAEAVSIAGARPSFVDVDPITHTVTADTLEPAITEGTKAIIAVHLYGRTVDLGPVLALARARRLRVVEDACQAQGARYAGRPVGAIGDIGCFSFYPSKNLGAWGDAGAVTTDSAELADRVRLLRSHGERPRHHHHAIGRTARLDAIQAAVLRVKLPMLERWNASRRGIAARLTQDLVDVPVSQPAGPLPGTDHVYHQYVVTTRSRDQLRAHLARHGVATAVHYPTPIHRSRPYRTRTGARLPVADRLARQVCSLPIYPAMTELAVQQVVDAIRSFDWSSGRSYPSCRREP